MYEELKAVVFTWTITLKKAKGHSTQKNVEHLLFNMRVSMHLHTLTYTHMESVFTVFKYCLPSNMERNTSH